MSNQSQFDWVSDIVVSDNQHRPQTWQAWQNPGHEPVMRSIFHEVLHYWQTLSCPAFTHVVVNEKRRFVGYLTGTTTNIQHAKYTEVNGLGLSLFHLIEGMTRYWDLHVGGPHRILRAELGEKYNELEKKYGPFETVTASIPEPVYTSKAYNYAMSMEDRYRLSYEYLSSQLEMNGYNSQDLTALFYPFIVFNALQSKSPVDAFVFLCDSCSQFYKNNPIDFSVRDFEIIIRGMTIEIDNWCVNSTKNEGFEIDSPDLILNNFLFDLKQIENEMCIEYLASCKYMEACILSANRMVDAFYIPKDNSLIQLAQDIQKNQAGHQFGLISPIDVKRLFMLPGITDHREFLVANFFPPAVIFRSEENGSSSPWMPLNRRNIPFETIIGKIADTLLISSAFRYKNISQNNRPPIKCNQLECENWNQRVCHGVVSTPKQGQECRAKKSIDAILNAGESIVETSLY